MTSEQLHYNDYPLNSITITAESQIMTHQRKARKPRENGDDPLNG